MKQVNTRYKMHEIVNKFLLAGDKFMPEMQDSPDLHIVLVDYLQKEERIQKFKEVGDLQYIYQNKLDKVFNITWLKEILKI